MSQVHKDKFLSRYSEITMDNRRYLPPLDGNVNLSPHIVLLGAGASIAAYRHWGGLGPALPSMQDLLDVLELRSVIEDAGFVTRDLNFEAFYDDLATTANNPKLQQYIEVRVREYFSALRLPDYPTIYDYLILALRGKDIVASFNWDPFLLQAYMRNQKIGMDNLPKVAFLHGNVLVGQ